MRTPNTTEGPPFAGHHFGGQQSGQHLHCSHRYGRRRRSVSKRIPSGWVNTTIHVVVSRFCSSCSRSDSKNLCHIFRNKPGKIHLRPIDVHTANVSSYLVSPGQYGEMDGWKIGSPNPEVRVEDLEQALELPTMLSEVKKNNAFSRACQFRVQGCQTSDDTANGHPQLHQEDSWEHVRLAAMWHQVSVAFQFERALPIKLLEFFT